MIILQTVQKRGAAVIAARKLSSAMSAAKAICDHLRDWWFGTGENWVSMGVPSDGSYGIDEGLIYSYPVKIKPGGAYEIVQVHTQWRHHTLMSLTLLRDSKSTTLHETSWTWRPKNCARSVTPRWKSAPIDGRPRVCSHSNDDVIADHWRRPLLAELFTKYTYRVRLYIVLRAHALILYSYLAILAALGGFHWLGTWAIVHVFKGCSIYRQW